MLLLSLNAVSAVDDNGTEIIGTDDEIMLDEQLAIEDDFQADDNLTASSEIVTNDNFNSYFDKGGKLSSDVNSKELTFQGVIDNTDVKTIVLDRSIKLTGENATLNNIGIDIKASNVEIKGFTINQNSAVAAISVSNASNVKIENCAINFNAVSKSEGYAVNADFAKNLNLLNNVITYVGATTGDKVNNGIRITNSDDAVIKGNIFDLTLVSAPVNWAEDPAGSGNWVGVPLSEGIAVKYSDRVSFENNMIMLNYSDVVGSYDAIYSLKLEDCDNSTVSNNIIAAEGHEYLYGIQVKGSNFVLSGNSILVLAEDYSSAIDIEGTSSGVVEGNLLIVKSDMSAYPIYSGFSGDVSAEYKGNNISAEAYFVNAIYLGDTEASILDNIIYINGNYTRGIVAKSDKLQVTNNIIHANASDIGDKQVYDSLGMENAGIKITGGDATITDNQIYSVGKGISVDCDKFNITDNYISVNNGVNSTYGIYMADSGNNIIEGNSILVSGDTAYHIYSCKNNENVSDSYQDNDCGDLIDYTLDSLMFDYGKSGSLTVDFDGVTIFSAYVLENSQAKVDIQGKVITVSNLDAGSYTLAVTILKNNTLNTLSTSVTVNKVDSIIVLNDVVFDYGESGTVNMTVVGAGVSAVSIANHTDAVTIKDNTISISNLDAGIYTLSVTAYPDNNHYSKTATATVTVNKIDPELYFDYGDVYFTEDYEEDVPKIDLSVSSNVMATGIVSLTISGKIYKTKISGGECEFTVEDLKPGKYSVKVEYNGDKNFNAAELGEYLTVGNYNSYFEDLENMEFDYGNSGSITVNSYGATGFTASVDNHPEAKVNIKGDTVTVSNLDAGTYTLTLTTTTDGSHLISSDSITVTVKKVDSDISLNDVTFNYSQTGATTVTTSGANAFTASIDNHPDAVNVNGNTIRISGLDAGTYVLTATTVPDGNHNSKTATAAVTVNKVDSSIVLGDVVFDYGKSGSVAVTTSGANGISAGIDNHPGAVSISGNTISISGLDVGSYTLTVNTVPDGNHNSKTATATVTVNKVDSSIVLNDVVFDYGSSGSVAVTTSGANGITAAIANHPDAVSINGNTISISGLDAGTYTLSATASSDKNHNSKTATATVTVNKIDSSISVGNVAFDYGMSGSTVATLSGAAGIVADIDGHSNSVSVSGNTVTVSGLNVGTYDLKIKTVPNSNYKEKSVTVKVIVNKADSNVRFSNDLAFDYGDSDYTTLILDGSVGFTASVAGHPNAVRINDYTVTVSGLDAGAYVLEVETIPDANHNSYKTAIPVTVNKADAFIEVNKLSAEYKKAKTWSIKLLDSNGNGIADKEITLNVYTGNNYKTYNVKTNSKGIATFSDASKLSKGTHKVALSISDANYKASSVSSSIAITQKTTKTVKLTLKAHPESIKKGTAITVTVKNGKKNAKKGIKVTVYVKKGKKDVMKPIVLKTVKRNGYSVVGFGTNKLAKGKYTAKFVVTSKGYSGQTTSDLIVKKKGKWQRIMT